jgi:ketosteroid isomerase-like protein
MKIKKMTGMISAVCVAAAILIGSQNVAAQETKSEKEISKLNTEFLDAANTQDIKGIMAEYATDVKSVNTDGTIDDYQGIIDGFAKMGQYITSLKLTKEKEDFKELTPDLILCTLTVSFDADLKSGQHMNTNHVASLLFKKISGSWKIIYEHASQTAPKMTPAQ